MNSTVNLLLFTTIIILVVSILYFYFANGIVFDIAQPSNNKTLDLNIPVHVLTNGPNYITYNLPNGKYDGQSILLVYENVNPTYNSNVNIRTVAGTHIVTSTYNNYDSGGFYPFSDGYPPNKRVLYRCVWYNGAWYIDNNNLD